MSKACDEYEVMISGYLDGELDAAAQRTLEEHLRACSSCRREFESMKRLVVGTGETFRMVEPPEVLWDTFLDEVYNRLERKTGWLLLIIGMVALAIYGVILFVSEPWATPLVKALMIIPSAGLIVLFLSVLRQRLRAARNDRYSREVHR